MTGSKLILITKVLKVASESNWWKTYSDQIPFSTSLPRSQDYTIVVHQDSWWQVMSCVYGSRTHLMILSKSKRRRTRNSLALNESLVDLSQPRSQVLLVM